MSKQLKGSLYYLVAGIRFELTVFWIILLAFLLITVTSAIMMPDSVVSFTISAPLYGYAAAIGFMVIKRSFLYLIKMGSTRKNLFLSFGLFAIGLSLFNALLANTLNGIITLFLGKEREFGAFTITENDSTMTFNHIGDFLGENTWLMRIVIDTSVSFFLLAVMFIIGLIFYRFGVVGGFSFLGAIVILFIIGMSKGWLLQFFAAIFNDFSFVFFYQLLGTGIVIYLLSFLLLRRITI